MKTGQNLAKKRLELMFTLGSELQEMIRCLHETKKMLIAARAKADNLPKKSEQVLQFVTHLPPKAMDVVREWFRSKVAFDEGGDFLAALGQLESIEDPNYGDEAYRASWRLILKAFVQLDCPDEITSFLQGNERFGKCFQETQSENFHGNKLDVTDDDVDLCLEIAKGNAYQCTTRLIPTAISGIISALDGDSEKTKMRKEDLAKNPTTLARKFELVISELECRRKSVRQKGLVIRQSTQFASTKIEIPHDYPFFGFVKRVLPNGHVFVRAAGIVFGNDLAELSSEQATEIFPSSGDATAFPGTISSTCCEGEAGIWNALHESPEKSSQYVINEHVSKVYDVFRVPHSSDQPDKVRQYLQSHYKAREDIFPVFLLSDGILLRIPGDPTDPNRFNFDNPLDGYLSHEAIQLQAGRLVVIKRLPLPDIKYDCAPATTWVKRMVKHRTEVEGFPSFSKTQLQALVEFSRAHADESTSRSYLRAKDQLQDTIITREVLEKSIDEMLRLPEVKASIEAEKQIILSSYQANLSNIEGEIARLEKQKQDLLKDTDKQKKTAQEEIARLKQAMRQHEVELEKRIKHIFDRATEDGIEALAQASFVKAIVSGTKAPQASADSANFIKTNATTSVANLPPRLRTEDGTKLTSLRDLRKAIEVRASAGGLSESMLTCIVSAGCACPVIGLLGERSRKVTTAIADLIANGVTCEVSVTGDMFGISDLMNAPALIRCDGHVWSTSLGVFLEYQQSSGSTTVIELRGINRAPPETFLPELLELGVNPASPPAICWTDKTGASRHASIKEQTIFVLTFVMGKSTFPLQVPLSKAVPILYVDEGWADEDAPNQFSVIKASQIKSEIWESLTQSGIAHSEGAGIQNLPSDPAARFRTAALALGLPKLQADAVAILSFQSGRIPASELEDLIERTAPEFIAYVKATNSGETARILNYVIQTEESEFR